MTKKKKRLHPVGTNFQGHYQHGDFIEELSCTYGQACNMLRKKWIKFRISKHNDDDLSLNEAMEEINSIQRILGIQVTEWKW